MLQINGLVSTQNKPEEKYYWIDYNHYIIITIIITIIINVIIITITVIIIINLFIIGIKTCSAYLQDMTS